MGRGGGWGLRNKCEMKVFLEAKMKLYKGWGALNGVEEHSQNLGRKKAWLNNGTGPHDWFKGPVSNRRRVKDRIEMMDLLGCRVVQMVEKKTGVMLGKRPPSFFSFSSENKLWDRQTLSNWPRSGFCQSSNKNRPNTAPCVTLC